MEGSDGDGGEGFLHWNSRESVSLIQLFVVRMLQRSDLMSVWGSGR